MFGVCRYFVIALCLAFAVSVQALAASDELSLDDQSYIAPVRIHTAKELSNLLLAAEQLAQQQVATSPIMFVLHGDEARSFLRGNYQANQSLVDRSAKLTALGVVQIEICERWMGTHGVKTSELQPFVKTVRYAPARISALEDKGYIYF